MCVVRVAGRGGPPAPLAWCDFPVPVICSFIHSFSSVGWMSLPELGNRLRDPSWMFVPDTRQLLGELAREGVRDYAALGLG